MYLHTLEMVRKLPVEILAVTQYEEIQQEMESYGIHVIWNDAPEEGISHSIHLGIRNSEDADAWMFVVCDQPYLRAETLEALLTCWALQSFPAGGCALWRQRRQSQCLWAALPGGTAGIIR